MGTLDYFLGWFVLDWWVAGTVHIFDDPVDWWSDEYFAPEWSPNDW